jgi:hypothetical protein
MGSEIAADARKLWPPDGVCATWAKNHENLVADTTSEDSPSECLRKIASVLNLCHVRLARGC